MERAGRPRTRNASRAASPRTRRASKLQARATGRDRQYSAQIHRGGLFSRDRESSPFLCGSTVFGGLGCSAGRWLGPGPWGSVSASDACASAGSGRVLRWVKSASRGAASRRAGRPDRGAGANERGPDGGRSGRIPGRLPSKRVGCSLREKWVGTTF